MPEPQESAGTQPRSELDQTTGPEFSVPPVGGLIEDAASADGNIRPSVRTRLTGGVQVGTIVLLRWVAVLGQTLALGIVVGMLELDVPVIPCGLAILALVGSNLWIASRYKSQARLTDYHTARILAFDLIEISVLVYFTGGLGNPFAILLAVPVTVSATVLSWGATLMLMLLALFASSLVAVFHEPLPREVLESIQKTSELPPIYLLGLWVAFAVLLVFMASYVWSVAQQSRQREKALAEAEAALAREQHMSALGGLAAAAAHELGSPLNTIALVSQDLLAEVSKDSPHREDIELLEAQSKRCAEILAALSRRPEIRGGDPYDRLLLTDLVEEAIDQHVPEAIDIDIHVAPESDGAEPEFPRSPEIMHGLGNIIQNAGQFARTTVTLELRWSDEIVQLNIRDDGPGFPGWILDSLGQPYLSTRSGQEGHMGLGIFIAQTLLDRTGAQVTYKNKKGGGAQVEVRWNRHVLARPGGVL